MDELYQTGSPPDPWNTQVWPMLKALAPDWATYQYKPPELTPDTPPGKVGPGETTWGQRATEAAIDSASFLPGLGLKAAGMGFLGAARGAAREAAPLYSGVERAVQNAKLSSGTPQEWSAFLRNQPGVKQQELEWLGQDVFGPGTGRLTREQAAEIIAGKKLQLGEIKKDIIPTRDYPYGEVSGGEKRVVNYHDPSYSLPGGKNYREQLTTLPSSETEKQFGELESSHWTEPNVLVHNRMNDRDIPGVGRSLHSEEIQSDWHGAGHKGGYWSKGELEELDRLNTEHAKLTNELNAAEAKAFQESGLAKSKHHTLADVYERDHYTQKEFDDIHRRVDYNPEVQTIRDELRASFDRFYELHNEDAPPKVPDAPFKKASEYGGLALKKMLNEAAEKGYDAISWTAGADQNKRWPGHDWKWFYDKELVNKANELGKKHGARVEQLPFTEPKLVGHGFVDDRTGVVHVSGTDPNELAEAHKIANQFGFRYDGPRYSEPKDKVHVMRITPQLREHILTKGFPLFTAAGAVGLSNQDEFVKALSNLK